MKERLIWIDILKGLGILTVVFAHCYIPDELLKKIIYTFHMPLFFLISGYLHKTNSMKILINLNPD